MDTRVIHVSSNYEPVVHFYVKHVGPTQTRSPLADLWLDESMKDLIVAVFEKFISSPLTETQTEILHLNYPLFFS